MLHVARSLLVTLVLVCVTTLSIAQDSADKQRPLWITTPKPIAVEPVAPANQLIRSARARAHNFPFAATVPRLDEQQGPASSTPRLGIGRSGSSGKLDPLPASLSTSIV